MDIFDDRKELETEANGMKVTAVYSIDLGDVYIEKVMLPEGVDVLDIMDPALVEDIEEAVHKHLKQKAEDDALEARLEKAGLV